MEIQDFVVAGLVGHKGSGDAGFDVIDVPDGLPQIPEHIAFIKNTALQGGSIMKGWTNDEKMMIACCNDGTRPVIFKIERMDVEEPEA